MSVAGPRLRANRHACLSTVQVTFTVGAVDEAERLSALLVDAGLAACAQTLGPITSRYRWEGKVESATEWLVVVKTTGGRADDVVAAIVEAHSYDVPEVLVTPVVAGNAAYLSWVEDEVAGGSDRDRHEPSDMR